MEKLELKHILPYLDYGLKGIIEEEIIINDTFFCDNLDIIEAGIIDIVGVNYGTSYLTECVLFKGCNRDGYIQIDNFKPLLHPLSSLTKEIEHNGERFVPIKLNGFKHDVDSLIDYQNGFRHYKSIKYGILQRLFEWHFDVFGLIEKGLAIDKNLIQSS